MLKKIRIYFIEVGKDICYIYLKQNCTKRKIIYFVQVCM